MYFRLLIFAFAFTLSACGGGETPVSETPLAEPAPIVSTDVKMGYGPHGFWAFDNASMPYSTQSVATKTAWGSGSITFSLTGLGYDRIGNEDFFVFFAKLKSSDGKEANFQYNIADKTPRLISQRFDSACTASARGFCEHQDLGGVNWNSAETYSFKFTWDSEYVYLTVKDSTGSIAQEARVPTDGAYAGVDSIHAGNGVLEQYGAVAGDIYIINPILE